MVAGGVQTPGINVRRISRRGSGGARRCIETTCHPFRAHMGTGLLWFFVVYDKMPPTSTIGCDCITASYNEDRCNPTCAPLLLPIACAATLDVPGLKENLVRFATSFNGFTLQFTGVSVHRMGGRFFSTPVCTTNRCGDFTPSFLAAKCGKGPHARLGCLVGHTEGCTGGCRAITQRPSNK